MLINHAGPAATAAIADGVGGAKLSDNLKGRPGGSVSPTELQKLQSYSNPSVDFYFTRNGQERIDGNHSNDGPSCS